MKKTTKNAKINTAKPAIATNPPAALNPAPSLKLEAAKAESTISAPKPPTAQPAPIQPARPKINRVCLELVRPGARQVCVAGTFNEWKPERTPLMPAGNGRWIGDLAVQPGRHEYLFVVDGQWLTDPNAKETTQNPFGGRNSVLVVSE